jgi:ABC-2 type transport system permease protein
VTPFLGILRRELTVALSSSVALVALGAFWVMSAVTFWLGLSAFEVAQQRALATNDPEVIALLDVNDVLLGSVLVQAQVLLLFVVPLLTMRAFASEHEKGTADLLYASPASTMQIVLGKLAGTWALLALVCGSLAAYPVLVSALGRPVTQGDVVVDAGQMLVGLLGVFLVGAVYAGVGLVASAATRSAAAAALATTVFLVALWFIGGAAPTLDGSAAALLGWLAPASHLERLVRGSVALADLGYFASLIVGTAALAHRLVDARRQP